MSEQKDLQEQLLLRAQECRKSVLVITTSGFQMRGIITGSDRFVIALKGDGRRQHPAADETTKEEMRR